MHQPGSRCVPYRVKLLKSPNDQDGVKRSGLTFIATCKPESGQRANDAKQILRNDQIDFPLCRIWSVNVEPRTRSCDNLLLLRSSKLSENCLGNGGWRLYRERIHEHVGGGRHFG